MFTERYLVQHEEVRELIKGIESKMTKPDYTAQLADIASEINKMAGVLRVHLSGEDQYLYPSIIKGNDPALSKMAKDYQDEMGDLYETFTAFKNKYNTKAKLMEHQATFSKEARIVFTAIKKRMEKEEKGLYLVIR
ncbi:MAG: hemerythrin domain-containing protein [bacterium]|nr:hemerythrin domain-containing protein [bacterium]